MFLSALYANDLQSLVALHCSAQAAGLVMVSMLLPSFLALCPLRVATGPRYRPSKHGATVGAVPVVVAAACVVLAAEPVVAAVVAAEVTTIGCVVTAVKESNSTCNFARTDPELSLEPKTTPLAVSTAVTRSLLRPPADAVLPAAAFLTSASVDPASCRPAFAVTVAVVGVVTACFVVVTVVFVVTAAAVVLVVTVVTTVTPVAVVLIVVGVGSATQSGPSF